ncbi:MAG: LysR substrate-binding domain-containing protein [Paracoccaceae bacterium]
MTPIDWLHLPPLPALRAFEAAARLGSFSAAARALNVTHPAVAQQVRGLERHLGLRLVAEAGRSLRLTAEGSRLALALNGGFSGIAAALAQARQHDHRRGLRITLTAGFAQGIVIPALPEFWAAHPDIPVSLVPESRLADLMRDGFDLAIRVGTGDWPEVQAEPLCRTRMMVVGAPALLDRGAGLADLPWILNRTDPLEAEWLASHGLHPERLQALDIENASLACAAAEQGLGLLFATDLILRDALAAGRLRALPGWTLPETAYWAVTAPGEPRAATRTFIDWLKRRLRKETLP